MRIGPEDLLGKGIQFLQDLRGLVLFLGGSQQCLRIDARNALRTHVQDSLRP